MVSAIPPSEILKRTGNLLSDILNKDQDLHDTKVKNSLFDEIQGNKVDIVVSEYEGNTKLGLAEAIEASLITLHFAADNPLKVVPENYYQGIIARQFRRAGIEVGSSISSDDPAYKIYGKMTEFVSRLSAGRPVAELTPAKPFAKPTEAKQILPAPRAPAVELTTVEQQAKDPIPSAHPETTAPADLGAQPDAAVKNTGEDKNLALSALKAQIEKAFHELNGEYNVSCLTLEFNDAKSRLEIFKTGYREAGILVDLVVDPKQEGSPLKSVSDIMKEIALHLPKREKPKLTRPLPPPGDLPTPETPAAL